MDEIIVATNNSGKLKEIQAILSPIRCIPQGLLNIHSAEETGLSFVENALIKARHASFHANKPALGDDSGLVVPALDGAPGIYSARFAGLHASDEDNNRLLLEKMQHLQSHQRQAYFYCAMALVQEAKDPTPVIATGIFKGFIAQELSGDLGFGYDPLFYCEEYHCTAAQLPATIKNQISHRAKALQQMRDLLNHSNERFN